MIHWPRTRSYIYIYGGWCCVRALFQPTPRFSSFVSRERESERKGAAVYNMKKKRPRADYSVKSVHLNSGLPFKTGVTVTFLLPLRSSTRRSVDSFCFVALFLSLSLSLCVYTFNFRRRYTITHTERRGNLQFHGNFLSIPFGQSVWFDLSTPWIPKNRTFGNYVSQLWTGQSKLFA